MSKKVSKIGKIGLRGIFAIAAASAITASVGALPAQAATKKTCYIGAMGTCNTGSLRPSVDGTFYIGTGAGSATVYLQVREAGTNFLHTEVQVKPHTVWHDHRGGFNKSKSYYLSGLCVCSDVVVSIENRPL